MENKPSFLNKFINNIYMLSFLAFLISIPLYSGYQKLIPFSLAAIVYFIFKKERADFKNAAIFAFGFAALRFVFVICSIYKSGSFASLNSSYILSGYVFAAILNFLAALVCFYIFTIICLIIYKALTTKMVNLYVKIMVLAAIFVFVTVYFIIPEALKYRFGYFIKGPEVPYNYQSSAVFKLDDGNIFFVGNNFYTHNEKILYTPGGIYSYKENKFLTKDMPKDLLYFNYSLLLKNNKLLLTCVSDPKHPKISSHIFSNKKESRYITYNKMAIIDLNTMKIEKIFQKTLPKNEGGTNARFTLLGDNKVFILYTTPENEIYAETIDLKNGNSKLLNKKSKRKSYYISKEIAINDNEILIFNADGIVEEYNYIENNIRKVGNILARGNFVLQRLNNNEIAILGGATQEYKNERKMYHTSHASKAIEIYNTKTNKSRIIGNMLETRTINMPRTDDYFAVSLIEKDLLFISGGTLSYYNNFGPNSLKSAEIFNYRTKKNYRLPDMPYRFSNNISIELDNGNILIVGRHGKTVLFKIWEKKK